MTDRDPVSVGGICWRCEDAACFFAATCDCACHPVPVPQPDPQGGETPKLPKQIHADICVVPMAHFADDPRCTCGLRDQIDELSAWPAPLPPPVSAEPEPHDAYMVCTDHAYHMPASPPEVEPPSQAGEPVCGAPHPAGAEVGHCTQRPAHGGNHYREYPSGVSSWPAVKLGEPDARAEEVVRQLEHDTLVELRPVTRGRLVDLISAALKEERRG